MTGIQIKEKKWIGHLACFATYAIFGFNVIICKEIANSHYISPMGLLSIRAVSVALLFWLISLFLPKEKIEKRDFLKILFASILGLVLPQMTFLFAITMTTPVDTSLVASLTPIFTMFVAAIAIKEPISWKKAIGVILSFSGVLLLIFNSTHINGGAVDVTQPMGFVLCILNSIFFALYLGIFRPLISKYSVITFMKWMFLFSMILTLPFSIKEIVHIDYGQIPSRYWMELLYLIIMATFVAYFLIPVGQKRLRPTVVSIYSYIQPILASIVSIIAGMDILNWQKIVAAAAVFAGLIIVNKSRSAGDPIVKREKEKGNRT